MSEAVEETGSLSDHEAQFYKSGQEPASEVVESSPAAVAGPEAKEAPEGEAEETSAQKEARARDESGKFTKHRAQTQKASPEDVPRIKELTKRLREAEERAAEYERRASERGAEPRRAPEPAVRAVSAEFTDKEPTIEQFEKESDPYAAYMRALARYDRKKEAFEADQQRVAAEQKRVEAAGQEWEQKKRQEYKQKADEFAATHADYNELISQYHDWDLPPLANATILVHENGPQLVYNLLKKPDELAGLILLTDGKPVNEKTVALATRWLENRALDGNTGSPAPVVNRKPTPTPPNPVRTVPSGSSDSSDDETMSLSDHERKYGRKRR